MDNSTKYAQMESALRLYENLGTQEAYDNYIKYYKVWVTTWTPTDHGKES